MPLDDILSAIDSHQWLPLMLIVALYCRKLVSAESKFPITLSPNWQPVVLGAFGLVVTVLGAVESGKHWGPALLSGFAAGVATGFFDGLVAAIFGGPGKAPAWATALLFLVDELGSSKAKPAQSGFVSVRVLLVVSTVSLAAQLALTACGWFASHPAVLPDSFHLAVCVLEHDSEPPIQIAKDCGDAALADVVAILDAEKRAMARHLAACGPDAGAR